MSSKLSPHQIAQDVYDEPSHSVRTTLQNLEIAVELSADDGDSVEVRKPLFVGDVVVPNGTANGAVLAQGDVRYFSEYQVSVNVIEAINAQGLEIDIEVSPSDTDEVWHFDSQIIPKLSVPNTGFAHIKSTSIGPWRRARAVLKHNGFTAGSFKLYVAGR